MGDAFAVFEIKTQALAVVGLVDDGRRLRARLGSRLGCNTMSGRSPDIAVTAAFEHLSPEVRRGDWSRLWLGGSRGRLGRGSDAAAVGGVGMAVRLARLARNRLGRGSSGFGRSGVLPGRGCGV